MAARRRSRHHCDTTHLIISSNILLSFSHDQLSSFRALVTSILLSVCDSSSHLPFGVFQMSLAVLNTPKMKRNYHSIHLPQYPLNGGKSTYFTCCANKLPTSIDHSRTRLILTKVMPDILPVQKHIVLAHFDFCFGPSFSLEAIKKIFLR